MRNLVFIFSLFIFVGCVGTVSTKQNIEEVLTEEEVLAVINKFDEGWKNKNEAIVDSVLSEHYVYFTQSGYTFNRAKLVATAGSDVYTLQNMER
jgi:hypothetical protein